MKKVYLTIGAILCLIMLLSGGMCITVLIDEEEMVETHPIVQNSVDNVQNFIQEESVPAPEATEQPEPIPTTAMAPSYTDEELEILSIIVYQEAGGNACSNDTRRLVAQVFLNRVNDERFPDTFHDVATAERQYGRLYWTGIVWPDRAKYEGEQAAVQRARDIAKEVLESSEQYCPPEVVFQSEYVQGEIYLYQDGFYFCY